MAIITPERDIRERSISDEGVRQVLSGTPVAPYTATFLQLAANYGIDPNWALAYLRMESNFGLANTFSLTHHNLWDILCYNPGAGYCGQPQNWGAVDCNDPGNGYCYAVYPSFEVGLEAGFRLWRNYVDSGWVTWWNTLCRALCGDPSCALPDCNSGNWVYAVIRVAETWAQQYPYIPADCWCPDGSPCPGGLLANCPPGPVESKVSMLLVAGGMLVAGAAAVLSVESGGRSRR